MAVRTRRVTGEGAAPGAHELFDPVGERQLLECLESPLAHGRPSSIASIGFRRLPGAPAGSFDA